MRRDDVASTSIQRHFGHQSRADFIISLFLQEWKFSTLCDIYNTVCINKAVIFCNSRRKVEWLTKQLNDEDFTVSAMVNKPYLFGCNTRMTVNIYIILLKFALR